jgi:hypothetical protein
MNCAEAMKAALSNCADSLLEHVATHGATVELDAAAVELSRALMIVDAVLAQREKDELQPIEH